MKSWIIEYTTKHGEVFSVVCMRKFYAAAVIRDLLKKGISKDAIVCIGPKEELEPMAHEQFTKSFPESR